MTPKRPSSIERGRYGTAPGHSTGPATSTPRFCLLIFWWSPYGTRAKEQPQPEGAGFGLGRAHRSNRGLETVISRILSGEYSNPVRVVRFNTGKKGRRAMIGGRGKRNSAPL